MVEMKPVEMSDERRLPPNTGRLLTHHVDRGRNDRVRALDFGLEDQGSSHESSHVSRVVGPQRQED